MGLRRQLGRRRGRIRIWEGYNLTERSVELRVAAYETSEPALAAALPVQVLRLSGKNGIGG